MLGTSGSAAVSTALTSMPAAAARTAGASCSLIAKYSAARSATSADCGAPGARQRPGLHALMARPAAAARPHCTGQLLGSGCLRLPATLTPFQRSPVESHMG